MIIDLKRFITEERKYWTDLESILDKRDRDPLAKMNLREIKRFHYLYQRTASGLAKVMGFSAETDIRRYLESLVARAYTEVHELREKPHRFFPLRWFFQTFHALRVRDRRNCHQHRPGSQEYHLAVSSPAD
jgi:hypothetical protein